MRAFLLLGALAAAPAAAAAPDYVTITNEVIVDRPAKAVWARIGGWCAIADWLKVKCETVSGNGAVGSVRKLNDVTLEAMVAMTPTSYTYWQSQGTMSAFSYHGTLMAQPDGSKTRLTYVLFYDQAAMASDEVRASEHKRLDARFLGALQDMKRLAEAK
jgi:hypothetical protein